MEGVFCVQCGATNPPGARFCNQCGMPLATGSLATAPQREDTGEDRRVVTVLFADLANSTPLGATLDAEELRDLLARYFAVMAGEIHRHGGIVEKFIGDAIVGIFGLPQIHEDDPVRAVRAGLDMQIALAAFNTARREMDPSAPELAMRVGINTGEVIATSGPADGRDFLVTGDAVNVAARLQAAAEIGAVLVGPRTFRDTQGTVEYLALPPADLKGKSQPIRVWRAMRMSDVNPVPLARPRKLDRPRAPLVGRDAEMALLHSVFARVAQHRKARIVTITGAPGLGKTRLAREFILQAQAQAPVTALVGRCALYGEGIAFWPLAEMLRDSAASFPRRPATPPASRSPPAPARRWPMPVAPKTPPSSRATWPTRWGSSRWSARARASPPIARRCRTASRARGGCFSMPSPPARRSSS